MDTNTDMTKFNKAKGAIMGALWGDAIGAVLEYHQTEITEQVGKFKIIKFYL